MRAVNVVLPTSLRGLHYNTSLPTVLDVGTLRTDECVFIRH